MCHRGAKEGPPWNGIGRGSPVILIDWRIKKEDIPLNGTHTHTHRYIEIYIHRGPILYSGQGEREIDIYIYIYVCI